MERRYCELRLAEDGRAISGVAVRYGDEAKLPWGVRERIVPGAFGHVGKADVILNLQHDRARPLARTRGGGLTLRDTSSALSVEAEMPETRDANDALALVKAGVLRGLSIEFAVRREGLDSGVRVIERARLVGVAVVDTPAYPDSEIAARSRAASPWWF